jgi:hypothetical protein
MKRTLYSGIMAAAIFAAAGDTYAQSNVYSVNVVSHLNIPGPFIDRSWMVGAQSHQIGFQETRWGNCDSYHLTFVHTYSNSTSSGSHFTAIADVGVQPVHFWIQPWIAGSAALLMGGLVTVRAWRRRCE